MSGPLKLAADVLTAPAILRAGRDDVYRSRTGSAGCMLSGVRFVATRPYACAPFPASFVLLLSSAVPLYDGRGLVRTPVPYAGFRINPIASRRFRRRRAAAHAAADYAAGPYPAGAAPVRFHVLLRCLP